MPFDSSRPRLKLTAIRDQRDSLLDTATRHKLTLLDTVQFLCEAEVARKDERRIQMASSIAKFPFVRTLEGFEFAAQPSLDPKLIRELATCRWIGNGDALLFVPASPFSPSTISALADRVQAIVE